MIVFKCFLKVLDKCKVPIILYTIFLIFFGGFTIKTSEDNINFIETKPSVVIINQDNDSSITKNLVDYITKNSVIENITSDDKLKDALFYRDINYIIYIPKNYGKDFIDKKSPKIEIKSSGDYNSSYAQMMLERYIRVASTYRDNTETEQELIDKINTTLEKDINVEMVSKLDTDALSKLSFYYNFLSYSILAGTVYVISLILSSFKDEKIKKRTIISSMDYKKYNRILLFSNLLFAVVLWILYILISVILIKDVSISTHGLFYMLNSFIFTICALTIAFLIGNLVTNKNAINGIVNVVALGSSFLCGAFVPVEFLPNSVLKIAHILPTYWYIQNNEMLKKMQDLSIENLKPFFQNIIIILLFSILFVIITNIFLRKKQKIG